MRRHRDIHLGGTIDDTVYVGLLLIYVLLVQAVLGPFQQVVQQEEDLLGGLVHHLDHLVHLVAYPLLVHHHQDGVIHHFQRA